MNPDTNRFEELHPDPRIEKLTDAEEEDLKTQLSQLHGSLLRPDGSPVPKHWTVFRVGEEVAIKDYTFRVAYIGETVILFEPVGVPVIGDSIRQL